jgi:hypothetical protein
VQGPEGLVVCGVLQLLMKGQEEGLQELDNAVTRVGMLANHMNEELLAQGE